MSNTKLKVHVKQNPLDEAKVIGYVEGFSDGRLKIIEEFILFKLLKKNWKKVYNSSTKSEYLIK